MSLENDLYNELKKFQGRQILEIILQPLVPLPGVKDKRLWRKADIGGILK